MKKFLFFLAALLLVANTAFSDEKIKVFVSIMPQKYLAERIGGEKAEVSVLVPSGSSPENFDPSAKQIIELGKSDIYMTVGIQTENMFLSRIDRNKMGFVTADTSAGIEKTGCSHGHDHGHNHGEADPHIWTDPSRAAAMAENMAEALSRADSRNREYYMANLRALLADLNRLDRDIKEKLAPYKGRVFYIYHSALEYFADRYGLIQKSIETGSREPSPAQIRKIVAEADKDRVKCILMQPEFPSAGTEKIAQAIKGKVIRVSILEYDYIGNMNYLTECLVRAFEESK